MEMKRFFPSQVRIYPKLAYGSQKEPEVRKYVYIDKDKEVLWCKSLGNNGDYAARAVLNDEKELEDLKECGEPFTPMIIAKDFSYFDKKKNSQVDSKRFLPLLQGPRSLVFNWILCAVDGYLTFENHNLHEVYGLFELKGWNFVIDMDPIKTDGHYDIEYEKKSILSFIERTKYAFKVEYSMDVKDEDFVVCISCQPDESKRGTKREGIAKFDCKRSKSSFHIICNLPKKLPNIESAKYIWMKYFEFDETTSIPEEDRLYREVITKDKWSLDDIWVSSKGLRLIGQSKLRKKEVKLILEDYFREDQHLDIHGNLVISKFLVGCYEWNPPLLPSKYNDEELRNIREGKKKAKRSSPNSNKQDDPIGKEPSEDLIHTLNKDLGLDYEIECQNGNGYDGPNFDLWTVTPIGSGILCPICNRKHESRPLTVQSYATKCSVLCYTTDSKKWIDLRYVKEEETIYDGKDDKELNDDEKDDEEFMIVEKEKEVIDNGKDGEDDLIEVPASALTRKRKSIDTDTESETPSKKEKKSEISQKKALIMFCADVAQKQNIGLAENSSFVLIPKYHKKAFTLHFEFGKELSKWIPSSCCEYAASSNSFIESLFYDMANVTNAVKFIQDNGKLIPFIKTDRSVFSFGNGIWDAKQARVYTYGSEEFKNYCKDHRNMSTANFFPQEWTNDQLNILSKWSKMLEDFEQKDGKEREKVIKKFFKLRKKFFGGEPMLEATLTDQGYKDDRELFSIYAMLGRLLFKIRTEDTWQTALLCLGESGGGKSVFAKIFQHVYKNTNRATVNQHGQARWNTGMFAKKFLTILEEVGENKAFHFGSIQLAYDGQDENCELKGLNVKNPEPVECHFLMTGNKIPETWFESNKKSVLRRLFVVQFSEDRKQNGQKVDTKYAEKIVEKEIHLILPFWTFCYKFLRLIVGDEDVMDKVPSKFLSIREDVIEEAFEDRLGKFALENVIIQPDEPLDKFPTWWQMHSMHEFKKLVPYFTLENDIKHEIEAYNSSLTDRKERIKKPPRGAFASKIKEMFGRTFRDNSGLEEGDDRVVSYRRFLIDKVQFKDNQSVFGLPNIKTRYTTGYIFKSQMERLMENYTLKHIDNCDLCKAKTFLSMGDSPVS